LSKYNLYEVYKTKKHYDGTGFDGMFVVVMVTPLGQITNHYDNKYWHLFEIKEYDK
jgi:hypothetical protein